MRMSPSTIPEITAEVPFGVIVRPLGKDPAIMENVGPDPSVTPTNAETRVLGCTGFNNGPLAVNQKKFAIKIFSHIRCYHLYLPNMTVIN